MPQEFWCEGLEAETAAFSEPPEPGTVAPVCSRTREPKAVGLHKFEASPSFPGSVGSAWLHSQTKELGI